MFFFKTINICCYWSYLKHSRLEHMFVTKFKIIHHVLKILDIETRGHQIFLDQGIYSIGNIIHNKYDIYQFLVEKPHSKFFMADIYQIFIFQKWHHTTLSRAPLPLRLVFYTSSLKNNGIYSVIPTFLRNFIIHLQSRYI